MEFLNQRAFQREKKAKFAKNFEQRAHQMNQRQHLENTAMDFTPLRKSKPKTEESTLILTREPILRTSIDTLTASNKKLNIKDL